LDCGVCDANTRMHIVHKDAVGMINPVIIPTEEEVAISIAPQKNQYRVFYSKMGNLRFISHLDLMRMIFRLVRRNHLPVIYTQGFNPHPKISLGPPLPLGVEGEREFFDMSVSGEISQDEVSRLLKKNFEGTIDFCDVEHLDTKDKINWETEGIEVLEIKPTPDTFAFIEEKVSLFNEIQSFPIIKVRHEREITSDLKDIILFMHWDGNNLQIEKKMRGAGVYDILHHVFGMERTQTFGMRIVRKKIKQKILAN
jgi:radical SAM-linked protein